MILLLRDIQGIMIKLKAITPQYHKFRIKYFLTYVLQMLFHLGIHVERNEYVSGFYVLKANSCEQMTILDMKRS